MNRVADKIHSGTLPYITTSDMEDCLRNRIAAKAGATFFKQCFEAVVATDKSGLFVLSGGAAAACHVNENGGVLKCLDLEYYNATQRWLDHARLQRALQTCVQNVYENLANVTDNVRVQDDLTVLKAFQNGAFVFCGPVQLRLLPHVDTVCTVYNGEFDLMRFALQVETWSTHGVDEYTDQKRLLDRGPVVFNVYIVNIKIMKNSSLIKRCIRPLPIFGCDYHVLTLPLERVLVDQIMCLIKDIFTDRPNFKVARRKARICHLFAQLPQAAYDECVNGHAEMDASRRRNESVIDFCRKTLNIYGPALGCRKLLYAYFKTNAFTNQLPDYVAHRVNYPHRDCERKWKEFIYFLL
ncbi:hypothetical protein QKQ66_gp139 [Dione juno nucleopolyhedrovirus]|uniref:Uncharacterized protein n=1 Tax=Dione juno nucleopolyhedrovirus TaxID=2594175 RepID=A0AAE6LC83_9ABAC|nr:hypothetical protein QKQ66_gp139 [Dione juno nucleopolyhedrovirus]QDL56998.1 hypothetical protein DijuNPV-ORF-139 [Dione juno nucleopolyhedrovirus]